MRAVESVRLQSGITLVVEKVPGAAMVGLGAWVGGASIERGSEVGAAHMVEHLGAATTFDGVSASEAFLGEELVATTSHDSIAFTTSVPAARLGEGVFRLGASVLQPARDAIAFERERSVILNELIARASDEFGQRIEEALLLTATSRVYSSPAGGSLSALEVLTPRKVHDFHIRASRPGNIVVAVSGDVETNHVSDLLEGSESWARSGAIDVTLSSAAVRQESNLPIAQVSPLTTVVVGYRTGGMHTENAIAAQFLDGLLNAPSSGLLRRGLYDRGIAAHRSGSFHLARRGEGSFLVFARVSTKDASLAANVLMTLPKMAALSPASEIDYVRHRLVARLAARSERGVDRVRRLGHSQVLLGRAQSIQSDASLLEAVPEVRLRSLIADFRVPVIVGGER